MIIELNGATYIISTDFPDCKCSRWARIFRGYCTGHHPNCEKVDEEIFIKGFIKPGPVESKFICRVRSDTRRKISQIFRSTIVNSYATPEIYSDADTLEQLRDLIISHVEENFKGVSAKPLFIDRLLYIRYYSDGEFIFHEEYSYIEDEYETTRIYNEQDRPSCDDH